MTPPANTGRDESRHASALDEQALDERALDASALDEVLRRRAAELARPLPREDAAGDSIEVLCFRLGEERCALESRFVQTVSVPGPCTPVPGCPPHVRGVTNLRGEVLAVMDLGRLFELPAGPHEAGLLLVVGADRPEFGVLVDEVDEVRSLPCRELFPVSSSVPEPQRVLLRGVTQHALLLLDGERLLQDSRLTVDQR